MKKVSYNDSLSKKITIFVRYSSKQKTIKGIVMDLKKILIGTVAVLAVVGCTLSVWTFVENQMNKKSESELVTTEATPSDVAYVDVDQVVADSEIFKTEGKALQEKTEKTQQKLANRERNLNNEMQQLNEKYQKGLITTRDAETKMQELQKRAASWQNSAQKSMKELEEENFVFQNRLKDLVSRAIQEINANNKFKMVINKNMALLEADTTLDISNAVLVKMNELYKAELEEKK